ncbi:MAG TPA: type II toxin-antitoxin system RelE/ParE family toxin [Acidobacteriaceae bacterium]|nr:type II toxin-antitoxin system RelE/ParE family toxin [Acidobacteriaceae bacterium]
MGGPESRAGAALTPARSILFTPAAREELFDARDWYENESAGLGQQFLAAVEAAIERICTNPRQFPVVYKNVCRALLRRFPYALMSVIEDDNGLTVIACFHGSRDPAHWQGRR